MTRDSAMGPNTWAPEGKATRCAIDDRQQAEPGTSDLAELKRRVSAILCDLNNPEITEMKRLHGAAADARGILRESFREQGGPDIPEIKRRVAEWVARALTGVSFCEPDKPDRLFCIPDERPLSQIDLADPETYQIRLRNGELAPLSRLIKADLANQQRIANVRIAAERSALSRRQAAGERHNEWIRIASQGRYRSISDAARGVIDRLAGEIDESLGMDSPPRLSTVSAVLAKTQGSWRHPPKNERKRK